MNRIHHCYCKSALWKRRVESELMPWALGGTTLEGPALEIGPGPGVTTNYLRTRVPSLTVLENDPGLAEKLAAKFRNTSVQVLEGDATSMPFESGTFRTVFCFTMLHHVSSPSLQDRVLAEALRVLAPGGTFLGTDSRHDGDCGSRDASAAPSSRRLHERTYRAFRRRIPFPRHPFAEVALSGECRTGVKS